LHKQEKVTRAPDARGKAKGRGQEEFEQSKIKWIPERVSADTPAPAY